MKPADTVNMMQFAAAWPACVARAGVVFWVSFFGPRSERRGYSRRLRMRVGLDFGTTNSSAAIYDGERVRLLSLDSVI